MVGPGVSELAACVPVALALLSALGMLAALAVIWAAQPSPTDNGSDVVDQICAYRRDTPGIRRLLLELNLAMSDEVEAVLKPDA
jgi:hypothetical protein